MCCEVSFTTWSGEEILIRVMRSANAILPPGQEIVVYKNNSDGKGNSYGCHENYLMSRAILSRAIIACATLHFVTRQIFTGAGKVGTELPGRSRLLSVDFRITERADFFEEGGRPRDHPEASDHQHSRRAPCRPIEVSTSSRDRR